MKYLKDLMSLERRVAIITGGAGNIGSTFGEALAELGASIVIADTLSEKCESVSNRISGEYNVETLPIVVDITSEEDATAIPDQILDRFGRIDILINCAAFVGSSNLKGWTTPFLEQSIKSWREAIEVNLTAVFTLIQACVPALKRTGNGTIINIASIYGITGPDMRLYENTSMGNPAAYAVSKGGLLQLTRWLATVLAPEIRVNAITPGGVQRNQPEIFQKKYIERTPLQCMAREEDFKGSIAYLASDLSSYVTGQNLIVDGGWTSW